MILVHEKKTCDHDYSDDKQKTTWWRHQMETFSALLAICAGNSPVPGEFPTQRPVTRSFDVYFDLRSNKRLSKQPWGWWFETLSCSLWRHRNEEGLSPCHMAKIKLSMWVHCHINNIFKGSKCPIKRESEWSISSSHCRYRFYCMNYHKRDCVICNNVM